MKLSICIPSARDWKPAFGASLCGLVRKLTLDGVEFDLHIMQGASVLPRARQLGIDRAKSEGFTHVLFLDDDMMFANDLVDDLSSHGLDVVGVNYVNKNPMGPQPQTHGLDGQPVHSLDRVDVQEVGWIGFGAVLIKLDAVKDIPAPLFEMRWLEERGSFVGEDFYFCGKVRAHGVKIHVDHGASNKVMHVGDFGYREQPN